MCALAQTAAQRHWVQLPAGFQSVSLRKITYDIEATLEFRARLAGQVQSLVMRRTTALSLWLSCSNLDHCHQSQGIGEGVHKEGRSQVMRPDPKHSQQYPRYCLLCDDAC
jgi:hypothetical protein